jgi:hypothetical protein
LQAFQAAQVVKYQIGQTVDVVLAQVKLNEAGEIVE